MDWTKLIADLAESGLTQTEIGREIGISQPAVSDLASGRTKNVRWAAGEKLLSLHASRCNAEAPGRCLT